ncbi:MAG: zinc ribbon domain-containing protein [Candidatus Kariarchaeaceae archaeon]
MGRYERWIENGQENISEIPANSLQEIKNKLKSKCEQHGIKYKEIEESFTSQTCSSCLVVSKANRKHRGLYCCNNCGLVINADINGGTNIIRKVAPECIGSSGGMITPVRIRVVS